MKGILSYDSWLGGILNKTAEYSYLFFLWVVFSIPIVTIGASTCAFYYTFRKVLLKERGYIGRSFLKSFKENFKQGTGVFILQAVVCCILILSGYYTYLFMDNFGVIFRWFFIGCVIIAYIWSSYWLPYISCYEDKTITVLRNCWIIMMENIAWSFVIVVLFVIVFLLTYMYSGLFLLFLLVYMALNGMLFNHVLGKYMSPEIEEDNEKDMKATNE